jgi:glutathione S-transferase
MTEALDVAAARAHEGLRLVLSVGAPGPWGEAIKGMLHVKKIPHVRVRQIPGDANLALVEWTGIRNAPQLVCENGEALHSWLDLIYFCEERTPAPPLIPEGLEDRVAMFGLIREIAGEQGFAWSRRYSLFQPVMAIETKEPNPAIEAVRLMAQSYGYSESKADAAPGRVTEVLNHLHRRLEAQKALGSAYFVGDRLSALDIYWAVFAALVSPLPEALCPMPEYLRHSYGSVDSAVQVATTPELLRHRDFIYDEYLELPVRILQ